MAFDAQRTRHEVALGCDARSRDLHSALRALKRPPGSRQKCSATMVRPLRYIKRTTEEEKRAKRRAAQQRWVARNRQSLLQKKREWGRLPETLARRRELFRLSKESASGTGQTSCLPKPPPPPSPWFPWTTLDHFAKISSPRKDAFDGDGDNERHALSMPQRSVAPTHTPDNRVSF